MEKTIFILLTAVTMIFVACAPKSNSSGPAPAPAPVPATVPINPFSPTSQTNINCSGCITNGQLLLPGVASNGFINMRLDLLGNLSNVSSTIGTNTGTAMGTAAGDPKVAVFYNGPVMANGSMAVTAADVRLCNLRVPNTLEIRTLQPGMWATTIGSNIRVEAYGASGERVTMTIMQIVPWNSNTISRDQLNNFSMRLAIEAVNGQPCRTAYYDNTIDL